MTDQELTKLVAYLRRQGGQCNRQQPIVPVAGSELLKAADELERLASKPDGLREALDWLARHQNAQVYWYGHIYGDDDREPEEWRVDLENGSINDREWQTVGRGETPLKALLDAALLPQAKGDAE